MPSLQRWAGLATLARAVVIGWAAKDPVYTSLEDKKCPGILGADKCRAEHIVGQEDKPEIVGMAERKQVGSRHPNDHLILPQY